MATLAFWRNRNKNKDTSDVSDRAPAQEMTQVQAFDLDIAPNDPLLAYLQQNSGVLEPARLQLDSPALRQLREAGIQLVVPLVSQGELIGLINLGPRLSEQDYSSDDRKLLQDLATQAAPAVRVAQLVRQQQAEARERERIEQELRVARIIQQTLLPQEVPHLAGYAIDAYYQPAREVGGDFYDFIYFDDGHVGLVIGDVTDKGVPAALVMATTRSILRAAAERIVAPGQVLERTNEVLHKEIPQRMFVTCLYAVLNPDTGHLRYANAGHDLPYRRHAGGVEELRATGMPLGLMPGMRYEEKEVMLAAGDTVLFYSDGLAEAHDPQGGMFGFPRVQSCLAGHADDGSLVEYLLGQLAAFTGAGWEQEDDVTLVTLRVESGSTGRDWEDPEPLADRAWRPAASLEFASAPGNERQVMEKVGALATELGLPASRLDKLKTAVAEATMNAMEHGNKYQEDLPVKIELLQSTQGEALAVRITDHGGGPPIPAAEEPDLEAKLAGLQSPRGWGLFLIQNMVDEMNVYHDETHHTIELIMRLEE